MRKFKKKIATFITLLACVGAAIMLPFGGIKSTKADILKPIDMYLIAGQSNAAGYSYWNQAAGEKETFSNVWYAGQTNRESVNLDGKLTSIYTSSDFTQSFDAYRKSVTVGLGKSNSQIGPEYGMASVLTGQYTEEYPALIFKTAAGSTAILDQYSNIHGNWYPRSLWEEGYEPNIDTVTTDSTGVLYKLFLENFKRVYYTLIENGYSPKVKGMAWMQGEQDYPSGQFTKYAEALKAFITDIRNDLATITGDNTLTGMPFVIGEIAATFGFYNNTGAQKMAKTQQQVAEDMASSRVASFSTDDFILNDENGNVVGSDAYHYAAKDAKTLGQRFALKILELNGSKFVAVNEENGKAACTISGNNLSVALTPDKNHKLSQVLLNGVDVTANVTNGVYQTVLQQSSNDLVVKFIEKTKYAVTYESTAGAACQFTPKSYYEGDVFSLKVYPAKDYEIKRVLFNDMEMTYNTQTKSYEISALTAGTVRIETKYVGTAQGGDRVDSTVEEGGCSSAMSALGILPVLGLTGMGISLQRKRKNKR